MGDLLNLGCWQWVSIEYHSYEFSEGHVINNKDEDISPKNLNDKNN